MRERRPDCAKLRGNFINGTVIYMDNFETLFSFLNSELFTALITLFVGITALALYTKQRSDYKSDAALLILQEIRYAEEIFRLGTHSKTVNFSLYLRMLPTNNWNKNIHLFLNDLEETELDLISRFYSKCSYIDSLVSKISDERNKPNQVVISNPTVQQNQTILNNDSLMINTQGLLLLVSEDMEMVYNTPTGEKLKRLANKKPLFFIF